MLEFEWDDKKEEVNKRKHGVDFELASKAFSDKKRVMADDLKHSKREKRFYCFGKVGGGIMTVRFTYRGDKIRIIGAGYWRQGRKIYETENNIH